jgi:hypothetical protein
VAILYPGDREARRNATPGNNRFAGLFRAFADRGIPVEPSVYHDDLRDEVHAQLMRVDAVLVWVNPIEGGRSRGLLDAMLRELAAAGVFVSAHPDVILKLGTKEVLYRTRDAGWGCDTHLYDSLDRMQREFPARLAAGRPRVLKRNRGNGGTGVWKVQLPKDRFSRDGSRGPEAAPGPGTVITVRHARRGCSEEEMTLGAFYALCEPYFAEDGRVIDQEYQERLPEGMIRCYLTHDRVNGFGHQAVNALVPAPPGSPPSNAPQPGPRLYHPPGMPEFQALRHRLEREWVPEAQRLLGIDTASLPVLWDCDFLFGPKGKAGEDTYVLCEINASSVAPFPGSAVPCVVEATVARARAARERRGQSGAAGGPPSVG